MTMFPEECYRRSGMPDWLWQGILANWIYALVCLGVSVLVARLKRSGIGWLDPFLSGATCFLLLSILIMQFRILSLDKLQASVDVSGRQLASTVRAWLDDFHLGVTTIDDAASQFAFLVRLANGTPVVVRRPKSLDHYLMIQSVLQFSAQDAVRLKHLPFAIQDQIKRSVILAAARQKIGFTYAGDPLNTVTIERRIPITSELSEDRLVTAMDEVDTSIITVSQSFSLSLDAASLPDHSSH